MENKMDNQFKAGDSVCLKASPYKPKLTVEEVNADGSYKCFWVERGSKIKTKRETYNGVLLQKYVSPVGIVVLRHKY